MWNLELLDVLSHKPWGISWFLPHLLRPSTVHRKFQTRLVNTRDSMCIIIMKCKDDEIVLNLFYKQHTIQYTNTDYLLFLFRFLPSVIYVTLILVRMKEYVNHSLTAATSVFVLLLIMVQIVNTKLMLAMAIHARIWEHAKFLKLEGLGTYAKQKRCFLYH